MSELIFLSENKDNINKIYPENFINNHKVFNKYELIENANNFFDLKFIFSTWGMPQFSKEELNLFPNLKAVFYGAGSVQSFAKPFLEKEIKVFSAWAANAIPVAEFTFAQIILANKGYFLGLRKSKRKNRDIFLDYTNNQPGNFNVKVGLIGAGMIGKLVLKLLMNTQIEALVYDPYVSQEILDEYKAKKVDLDTLFSQCQIISNHLPNLPQTVGLINYSLLSKMKYNSTFINTGRGAQINEEDLIKILKQNPDMTALLDVTFPEPPDENSPFYTLDNVFLTPHIAGSLSNEVCRMGNIMIDEYNKLIKNEKTNYEITLKQLETMA